MKFRNCQPRKYNILRKRSGHIAPGMYRWMIIVKLLIQPFIGDSWQTHPVCKQILVERSDVSLVALLIDVIPNWSDKYIYLIRQKRFIYQLVEATDAATVQLKDRNLYLPDGLVITYLQYLRKTQSQLLIRRIQERFSETCPASRYLMHCSATTS